ncbi:uncharacterized protein METZ01_LOCUS312828 [marine metagenome]|uniref:Uncharacterized protein n=1 Tax=marine metagenome TaxID=408172 RepID=A0A382NFI5_9ZZZZ
MGANITQNFDLDEFSICFFNDFAVKSIFVGIPSFRSFDAQLIASDFNSSFT